MLKLMSDEACKPKTSHRIHIRRMCRKGMNNKTDRMGSITIIHFVLECCACFTTGLCDQLSHILSVIWSDNDFKCPWKFSHENTIYPFFGMARKIQSR